MPVQSRHWSGFVFRPTGGTETQEESRDNLTYIGVGVPTNSVLGCSVEVK